ncbi:MAG: ATP-binding protein [Desulfobacterales bacterium]|nr:ATP-binding protein [Desulfobacterales bacterium]MDD4070872.1 ATP-binding protein [Desulfobacterales bacterium]MDD4392879.1 ATP-binding protein [Desulfobacterales bacterium]
MTSTKIFLRLKTELSELNRLSRALNQFGATLKLPPAIIFKINLALEELICNIISYGHPENRFHQIDLSVEFKTNALIIHLNDDGIPFNPLNAPCPDLACGLENRKIGGLGIQLVKSVMDEVCYQRYGNINSLTLKKYINK